jgi:hypothetical protein
LAELRQGGASAADVAAGFFECFGFRADRTTMNLYGYPGLLRDLTGPPPWVEIEPEDCDGRADADRLDDLRPLYRHANDFQISELSRRYKQYLDERLRFLDQIDLHGELLPLVRHTVNDVSIAQFEDLLALARCIGAEAFENVAEAVFEYDEFPPFPGAPDLLVWLPDPNDGLWFFAEVKAPNDSLRKSQRDWLRTHWERIRGRFVQVSLE